MLGGLPWQPMLSAAHAVAAHPDAGLGAPSPVWHLQPPSVGLGRGPGCFVLSVPSVVVPAAAWSCRAGQASRKPVT